MRFSFWPNAGQSWTISTDALALPSDVGNPSGGGFGLAGISVRIEMAIAPSDPNRLYAAVVDKTLSLVVGKVRWRRTIVHW